MQKCSCRKQSWQGLVSPGGGGGCAFFQPCLCSARAEPGSCEEPFASTSPPSPTALCMHRPVLISIPIPFPSPSLSHFHPHPISIPFPSHFHPHPIFIPVPIPIPIPISVPIPCPHEPQGCWHSPGDAQGCYAQDAEPSTPAWGRPFLLLYPPPLSLPF